MSLLSFKNVSVRAGNQVVLDNIQYSAKAQNALAIVGESGSGKTTLAETIAGKRFHSGYIHFPPEIDPHKIVLVTQQHQFKNKNNLGGQFYYQQRYNASESEDAITASAFLFDDLLTAKAAFWINEFGLSQLLDKPLIQLSNGENKRVQLVKALLQDASLLILDDPFVGIDKVGREYLHKAICRIVGEGKKIVLVTSTGDIPQCMEEVVQLSEGSVTAINQKKYNTHKPDPLRGFDFPPNRDQEKLEGPVVRMKNVNLRYGQRHILKNINWEVSQGDCWHLAGPNGAGKSSLLSLITADNPQAYANEIYLFGKRRGSGESIWEIKKKIGFVSPELHLYFDRQVTTANCIASGLFDTIGLFKKLNAEQDSLVNEWVNIFELSDKKHLPLSSLSIGQQRKALLARALIKAPPLLVLDEPTQGLDDYHVSFFKKLVDDYCNRFNSTLVYVTHYEDHLPLCVDIKIELTNGIADISTY